MFEMSKFLIRLIVLLAIFGPIHATNESLRHEDRVEISKLILRMKITILDRHGQPVMEEISVALLIDGRRDLRIENASSKELPIRFIPKVRQAIKDRCWIDSQTEKSVMGIDIGPFSRNADGSVSVDAGSSICFMGSESTTYTFRWNDGKWVLKNESLKMII
ncbi:hypothetical protein [Massilia sp. YIM B04103]|uniref:hypothetical protein n=1 Tax=Massilia sp. YIM B04103 TaxID=2963106 RepID=UPI00210CBF94|nr:hypothetical protein [Massilia sp. YIM B04103]